MKLDGNIRDIDCIYVQTLMIRYHPMVVVVFLMLRYTRCTNQRTPYPPCMLGGLEFQGRCYS